MISVIHETKITMSDKKNSYIKTKDILKKIYKSLNIDDEILSLIYGDSNKAKFIYDEFSMK
jgi:hypothetical protein